MVMTQDKQKKYFLVLNPRTTGMPINNEISFRSMTMEELTSFGAIEEARMDRLEFR